jgi:hypothetical protein
MEARTRLVVQEDREKVKQEVKAELEQVRSTTVTIVRAD